MLGGAVTTGTVVATVVTGTGIVVVGAGVGGMVTVVGANVVAGAVVAAAVVGLVGAAIGPTVAGRAVDGTAFTSTPLGGDVKVGLAGTVAAVFPGFATALVEGLVSRVVGTWVTDPVGLAALVVAEPATPFDSTAERGGVVEATDVPATTINLVVETPDVAGRPNAAGGCARAGVVVA